MLFNSFSYLLFFLPVTVIIFFVFNRMRLLAGGTLWLVSASLFFYAYWKIEFLPIIVASILVNYSFGKILSGGIIRISLAKGAYRRGVLVIGVLFNVSLLGYFKYADFIVININQVFASTIPYPDITLPLGISFFTFQQIAYLVDSYKGHTREYSFINYALFVSFFPQLIAGPIVHHKEMMPQFARLRNKYLNWKNVYTGFFFVGLGLFKKVGVADTFAVWVNDGFKNPETLTFLTAWKTSLSYTIQLYFDFSAYTDMAIGSAMLVNIKIPQNFNAPYLSLSIQDFWRRWHITLGRFLRDYIYIPLGGNRKGNVRTYINLFLTFLIGGIWHGAGWTFVMWGAMHGLALCANRYWTRFGYRLPKVLAWSITFLFVNAAWVVFRAETFHTATIILQKMVTLSTIHLNEVVSTQDSKSTLIFQPGLIVIIIYVFQDLFFRTTQVWAAALKPNLKWSIGIATAIGTAFVLMMSLNRFTEFIYFQF